MKLRGGLVLLLLAGCAGTALGDGGEDNPPPNPKWFVCKYETTPNEGERLQTGQNPISVSENAFPAGVTPAVGVEFNDAQGRSLIIAEDVGQPEPSPDDCPPPNPGTTTTTAAPTTTTTTTTVGPTTTRPTAGLFAIEVEPTCPDGTLATIEITFGDRPDLDGQTGTLTFSTGGSVPLTFDSGATVEVPYPASAAGGPVTMTYTLGAESVTRSTTFPEACAVTTTTTGASTSTTSPPATTTTTLTTTTSVPGSSTSTTVPTTTVPFVPGIGPPPVTPPILPPSITAPPTSTPTTTTPTPPTTAPPFVFGAAATVCVREVPTIRINFQNTFPELAGRTGTLTMADVNGNVVSTQALVYRPNTTVDLLYPGTTVFDDGSISDVPGWILTDDGLWIRDPSDEFLRDGINLTYTVNPTATAFITYPPESSACANPDNPVAPPVRLPPTR